MSQVARNAFAILAAVIAAYIALAIASTLDTALGYPRSYSSAGGEMILRLTGLWPFIVAAVVLGIVAALIARPLRQRRWLFIVGILAAGQYAISLRYVAPELQEWLKTMIGAAIIGSTAVCAFWLIARRTGNRRAAPASALE